MQCNLEIMAKATFNSLQFDALTSNRRQWSNGNPWQQLRIWRNPIRKPDSCALQGGARRHLDRPQVSSGSVAVEVWSLKEHRDQYFTSRAEDRPQPPSPRGAARTQAPKLRVLLVLLPFVFEFLVPCRSRDVAHSQAALLMVPFAGLQ